MGRNSLILFGVTLLLVAGESRAAEVKTFNDVADGATGMADFVRLAGDLLSPCVCANEFQTRDCKARQERAAIDIKAVKQVFTDQATIELGTYDFKKKVFPARIKLARVVVPVGFCSDENADTNEAAAVRRRVVVSSGAPQSFVLEVPDEAFARYLREHTDRVRMDVILSVSKTTRETAKDEDRAAEIRREIEIYENLIKSGKLKSDVRALAQSRIKALRQVDLKVNQLRADMSITAHRFWLSKLSPLDEGTGFEDEGADPDTTEAGWFDKYIYSVPASDAALFSEYSFAKRAELDQKCRIPDEDFQLGSLQYCIDLASLYGRWGTAAALAKRREYLGIACETYKDQDRCEELRLMPAAKKEDDKAEGEATSAAGE